MQGHFWITRQHGLAFPKNAFHAGYDSDGADMFIGKAIHERDILPAKLVPSREACYVAYDGLERLKNEYEVLCGDRLKWVSSSEGQVPNRAVQGGKTVGGERLYIGRVSHYGGHSIGKVHPSMKVCLFPYNGEELQYKNYEVLIGGEVHYWTNNMERAFVAGVGADGGNIYIGKAKHEGDLLPAMIVPNQGTAYVSYGGRAYEKEKSVHEVLCGCDLKWVPASEGQVPPKSVIGGETYYGEKLYIGRVNHLGSKYIGKVHPSNRCCYIPHNSQEIYYESYEILVDE